jgi:predicted amidophosphoribosyltransferase
MELTGVLIAGSWEDLLLRQLIYEYKYRFIRDLSKPLSQILVNFLKTSWLYYYPVDDLILVPIPLHPKRLTWRGFNQAELLSKEISNYLGMPMIKLLERKRSTKPQAEIKKQKERKKNIESAFALSQKHSSLREVPRKRGAEVIPLEKNIDEGMPLLNDKIIILIDDITTTGSTLEECAKVLKPLKPKGIWGLVLARG